MNDSCENSTREHCLKIQADSRATESATIFAPPTLLLMWVNVSLIPRNRCNEEGALKIRREEIPEGGRRNAAAWRNPEEHTMRAVRKTVI
ncbi:hypothetical protein JTE90_005916 [Oedothorax gibbosus]|uniref:Uncharacterized protein n=1 Tax=Oedothorax gibbosus TaxID=931172 RepID=A0AAV6U9N7_9ARAC|nr:hypothetical protein JTE90_005916 [Oedothorax gibbosus]